MCRSKRSLAFALLLITSHALGTGGARARYTVSSSDLRERRRRAQENDMRTRQLTSTETPTMLSYIVRNSTEGGNSLEDHALLHRTAYGSSNTVRGERLASLTPGIFPQLLANTFVDERSDNASTRVTQLLYDPYIVPLFAFNFTRCNAESTNVNADCTWTKSTLPLVEPKSYVKVVQHNALHEDHGLVLKRPDETAFMQKLLELNYPGAVALQFCLGGMDLATLRTSNLTLQLLDSVNGIDSPLLWFAMLPEVYDTSAMNQTDDDFVAPWDSCQGFSTTETTQWLLLRTHGDDVFELSREETQSMYARAVLEGRPEYAADQEDPNHIPPLRDFVHRRNPPKGSWNQVRIHNWGHSKLDFMLGDFYAVTEDHPTEIILTHAEKLSCERGPTLPPPNTESFRYNSYEWMDPITNTAIFLSETPSVLECAYLCNRVNIGKSTSTATSADQHSHTGHLLCSGFDYNFDNSKCLLRHCSSQASGDQTIQTNFHSFTMLASHMVSCAADEVLAEESDSGSQCLVNPMSWSELWDDVLHLINPEPPASPPPAPPAPSPSDAPTQDGAGFTFTPTMAVILLGCGTGAVMCSWLLVCIRRRREPKHDPWDQLSQLFPHLVHGSSFKDAHATAALVGGRQVSPDSAAVIHHKSVSEAYSVQTKTPQVHMQDDDVSKALAAYDRTMIVRECVHVDSVSSVFSASVQGCEVAATLLQVKPGMEEQASDQIELLSQFEHRALVKLLGCSYRDPHFCVVTEYCSGKSLHALLHSPQSNQASFCYGDVLDICQDVASALAFLHPTGNVHGSVSARHVLLTPLGKAKLSDLGVTSIKQALSRLAPNSREGSVTAYLSKELVRGDKVSDKDDVYAFGVLLWECLSRKQPNEAWLEYHKGHFKSAFLLKSQPVEDGSVATTPAKLRLRMDSSWPRVVVSLILACWNSPDTRPDSTRLVMLLQQARHDLEAAQLIDTPVRNSSPAATGLSLQSSIPVASSVGQKIGGFRRVRNGPLRSSV